MRTAFRFTWTSLLGIAFFGLLLFWPAGTFHYWRGWAFIAVFTTFTLVPSLYLLVKNPAALQRRMRVGPTASSRRTAGTLSDNCSALRTLISP